MDQVKEIGELIGVSWVRANEEVKEKDHCGEGNKETEGMGESRKKGWIRSIIKDECPDVIGLQETKSGLVDDFWVEDIWGKQGYGYSQLPANGNLGGIMLIWDTRVFECKEAVGDESHKASLWERLSGLMNKWQGAWCIFGDLNVVRRIKDIFNSQVNVREMVEFNGFINNMKLIEIPTGGRKFTRVSDDGLKFSKLYRFLLNENFNDLWGNPSVVALDRKLLDHCPMVIKDVELDFGPKPFRIFNVRMEEPDFISVIEEAWRKDVRSSRPDCVFRDRLKNIKASLKIWSTERFNGHKEKVDKLRNEAMR
ncbi:RNA-directed DNA polymerase, eukaryota [Tanacetum coccineum]